MKTAKTNRKTTTPKATKPTHANSAATLAQLVTAWRAHDMPLETLAAGFGAALGTEGDETTLQAAIAKAMKRADSAPIDTAMPQDPKALPMSYLVALRMQVSEALGQWIKDNAPKPMQRLSWCLDALWDYTTGGGWIFENDPESLNQMCVDVLQILATLGDWDTSGGYAAHTPKGGK